MAQKRFMTTAWTHLAMLNFEVDPKILRSFVPCGTELDEFNGRCFVSMVGFLCRDTQILGLAVPGYRSFPEINLRYYVRYRACDGWRRGVAFIKEIVPLRAVTWTARKFYDENFATHPMRYKIETNTDDPDRPMRVEYAWKSGQDWHRMQIRAKGSPLLPERGSEEEFIAEHYWAYTARRDGSTSEYRVTHPQWRVWSGTDSIFECDVASIYGSEFVDSLRERPSSAFIAEGSPVTVYGGQKLSQESADFRTHPQRVGV